MYARMHAYIHTYINTKINKYTHIHTYYKHTCMHAHIHTAYNIHADIHDTYTYTYMHTCIHTYIHTCGLMMTAMYFAARHRDKRRFTDQRLSLSRPFGSRLFAQFLDFSPVPFENIRLAGGRELRSPEREQENRHFCTPCQNSACFSSAYILCIKHFRKPFLVFSLVYVSYIREEQRDFAFVYLMTF